MTRVQLRLIVADLDNARGHLEDAQRLLAHDRSGENALVTVRVAHDALTRAWRRLKERIRYGETT